MPTRSRPFASKLAAAAFALLVLGGGVFATRASSSTPAMERELRAAYPRTPLPATSFAGVDIDKLAIGGYRLLAREDHPVDDGAIILSYGDADVRVVVELAVARDAESARRFVDVRLHAISTVLPAATDPLLGDYAFARDGVVVGAAGNVGWVVRALEGATTGAADVVHALRALAVPGAPSFPSASIALPATFGAKDGADVQITPAPSSAHVKLRAEGAYLAHGKTTPRLKPFKPGAVTVVATVTDDLGRVTELRASATAL